MQNSRSGMRLFDDGRKPKMDRLFLGYVCYSSSHFLFDLAGRVEPGEVKKRTHRAPIDRAWFRGFNSLPFGYVLPRRLNAFCVVK